MMNNVQSIWIQKILKISMLNFFCSFLNFRKMHGYHTVSGFEIVSEIHTHFCSFKFERLELSIRRLELSVRRNLSNLFGFV